MSGTHETKERTLLQDIRLIFATILTDPGSSLAYGTDALVAVTIVLLHQNYEMGVLATATGGGIILGVYLVSILAYNTMIRHHTHRILGGGAFVSALITSRLIRNHTGLRKFVRGLGKMGTASLLADFPATQAISIIAGIEALYFIPVEDRLQYAIVLIVALSFVQRYGLGNLAKYMIWPVAGFYLTNLAINSYGLYTIYTEGWHPPVVPDDVGYEKASAFIPLLLSAVANGATLITGVEVGYSSVNIPHHKGKAIRISMWILYLIVLLTYSMQLINFLGLGVQYSVFTPVPIQIAQHLGGDMIALPFGILTAIMLLLAAQTAHSDFPLEVLRAARSRFFPRGLGDMSWKKTKPLFDLGGHDGVYNPRATILLSILSLIILYFFPSSHKIEGMYGLAVVTAMNIDLASFLLRQIRAKKINPIVVLAMVLMVGMLWNIVYNKFFDGAWFIVVLTALYFLLFVFSETIYEIWDDKLKTVPLELGLWYPAFQNLPVDKSNIVLVSKFHPGVIHFLKNFVKSGSMPLVLHFHTEASEPVPRELPEWYQNIQVEPHTDTITAITRYIRDHKPERVHLIPLMVRGMDPILKFYFGNSIERLKYAISRHSDLQVEYNKERVVLHMSDVLHRMFPFLPDSWFGAHYEKTDV